MRQNMLTIAVFLALIAFAASINVRKEKSTDHSHSSSTPSNSPSHGSQAGLKSSSRSSPGSGKKTGDSGQRTSDDIIRKLLLAPTAVERINILDHDSNFTFNFLEVANNIPADKGGKVVLANREAFPALTGNGMSMAIGFLGPCGLNAPHTHPRATEVNFAVNGSLLTGFIAEIGARQVNNVVPGGSAVIFPKGSIHWLANLGCDSVTFVASLNDEDPGLSPIAQNFFSIDEEVLSATLGGVSSDFISKTAKMIPDGVILGLQQCLQDCGLAPAPSNDY